MRISTRFALAALAIAMTFTAAGADVAFIPGPMRLANADAMVVGRVVGFSANNVMIEPYPNTKKVNFRIALIKVNQGLFGAKKGKLIKVGYVVRPAGAPVSSRPPVKLDLGQEGLFYLTKHHKADFFVIPMLFQRYYSPKYKTYQAELKLAEKGAKTLQNPIASLKTKNVDDRLFSAALLIYRYRIPRGGNRKQQPIAAQESQLILQALLGSDWNKKRDLQNDSNPLQVFNMLGLTAKDGWQRPKTAGQYQTAAKNWLRANLKSYRIKKFVQ